MWFEGHDVQREHLNRTSNSTLLRTLDNPDIRRETDYPTSARSQKLQSVDGDVDKHLSQQECAAVLANVAAPSASTHITSADSDNDIPILGELAATSSCMISLSTHHDAKFAQAHTHHNLRRRTCCCTSTTTSSNLGLLLAKWK